MCIANSLLGSTNDEVALDGTKACTAAAEWVRREVARRRAHLKNTVEMEAPNWGSDLSWTPPGVDRIGLHENMGWAYSIFVFDPENEAFHKTSYSGQATEASHRMSSHSIRHVRDSERRRVGTPMARLSPALWRMDKAFFVIIAHGDNQSRHINTRNWWLDRSETELIAFPGGLWRAADP